MLLRSDRLTCAAYVHGENMTAQPTLDIQEGNGSVTRNPVVARRRLGAALRELRLSTNLKIEDAARKLECSNAKVSRLETGKGIPRQRDVRDLIELYGVAAKAREAELVALVNDSNQDGGLDVDFRDVIEGEMMSAVQSRYMALEQDATSISTFESGVVPGILQTEAYAEAVALLIYPDSGEVERRRFVQLRMERQAALRRPGGDRLQLSVVLGEQMLRRPIGGDQVIRKQLEHMVASLRDELADVDFRVAPLTLVVPGVLGGPFSIVEFADPADQDIVYLEGDEGGTYLETDEQVARYKAKFAALAEACPDRESSINIVEDAAKSLS